MLLSWDNQRLIEYAKPGYTPPHGDLDVPPDEPAPPLVDVDVDAARVRLKSLRDAPTEEGGGRIDQPIDFQFTIGNFF